MGQPVRYDDYLAHYGVKGMKWGVRKNSPVRKVKSYVDRSKERYNKDRTRELRRVELTSKNGEKVVATEDRNPKFASFLTSISDKSYKDTLDNPSFSIAVDGAHVGESSFSKKDNGEINLVWLGINPAHRGKGYASSVFDAAVEYGKSEGANKLTLEVPGNAPDARHIYEKRGFKVTKEADPSEAKKDYVWGGLTYMELDLKNPVLTHSNDADLELEKALEETFTKLPRDVEKEVFKNMSDVKQSDLDYDDYLAHYGIKGMKWGRRKNRHASSDAKAASATKSKAKKLGSESLSNKELKSLQDRRNLEKNAKVRPKERSKSSEDSRDVGGLKKVANKKGVKALSNDELQATITRMELEKKYSQLTKDDSKSSAGKDFVSGILKDAATNVATSVVEDMMRNAGGSAAGAARKRYDARRATPTVVGPGRKAIGR